MNNRIIEPLLEQNQDPDQLPVLELIFPFFNREVLAGNYTNAKRALKFAIFTLSVLLIFFGWIFWITILHL